METSAGPDRESTARTGPTEPAQQAQQADRSGAPSGPCVLPPGTQQCAATLRDYFTDGTDTPCGRPLGHPGDHFPVPLVEDLFHT